MALDFNIIKEYSHFIDTSAGDFLEIGSDRGEDSTGIIGEIAKTYNKILHSVDMDPLIIQDCENNPNYKNHPNIKFYNETGEDFLDKTDKKFTLALLDNYDWNWWAPKIPEVIVEQGNRYKKLGFNNMTNLNSQVTHLKQAMKLIPKMTDISMIICDDTFFVDNYQTYQGKCGAAVPYLLIHGYKIIFKDDSRGGVILVRTRK